MFDSFRNRIIDTINGITTKKHETRRRILKASLLIVGYHQVNLALSYLPQVGGHGLEYSMKSSSFLISISPCLLNVPLLEPVYLNPITGV